MRDEYLDDDVVLEGGFDVVVVDDDFECARYEVSAAHFQCDDVKWVRWACVNWRCILVDITNCI